jgi:glycyl-tRNA synthetase beta chain
MQQDGLRYDIIEAVLGASDHDLLAKVEKGQVLNERLKDDNFKSQAESLIRVTNIARKLDRPPSSVKESLLKQNEERELSRVYQTVHEKIAEGIVRRQWDHVMDALLSLKEPIDHFFEAVMVMVEDEQLRYNRLNLLAQMAQDIYYFADFGQLVFQKS